jgi:hypothetical protein
MFFNESDYKKTILDFRRHFSLLVIHEHGYLKSIATVYKNES